MIIGAALGLDEQRHSSVKVHSLAKSVIHENEMTATASFGHRDLVRPNEAQLSSWNFEIPRPQAMRGERDDKAVIITIDTTFNGFTPLNSFDKAEEHLFEYAPILSTAFSVANG
jgi:hypothetical protein